MQWKPVFRSDRKWTLWFLWACSVKWRCDGYRLVSRYGYSYTQFLALVSEVYYLVMLVVSLAKTNILTTIALVIAMVNIRTRSRLVRFVKSSIVVLLLSLGILSPDQVLLSRQFYHLFSLKPLLDMAEHLLAVAGMQICFSTVIAEVLLKENSWL